MKKKLVLVLALVVLNALAYTQPNHLIENDIKNTEADVWQGLSLQGSIKIDSVLFNTYLDETKDVYSYDNNENLISISRQYYFEDCWNNWEIRNFYFDSLNRFISYSHNVWLYELEIWEIKDSLFRTYNLDGNIGVEHNWHDYFGLGLRESKNKYLYDENRLLVSVIKLDKGNNYNWTNISNREFVYDSLDRVISTLYQNWNDDEWHNWRLLNTKYDSLGNIMEYCRKGWEDSLWINASKTFYQYNSYGNYTISTFQEWENEQWMDKQRDECFYDVNGSLLSVFYYYWNDNNWENKFKNESQYLSERIITTSYEWENNQWNESLQGFGMILIYEGERISTISYVGKADYYFSSVSGIYDDDIGFNKPNILLYPNPASETIYIETKESFIGEELFLELYSITGQVVLQKSVNCWNSKVAINISGVANGIYSLRITSKTQSITKKFMINN